MQNWKAPSFVEIAMNAEIGSYQNEFDERQDPPFGRPEARAEAESEPTPEER